MAREIVQSPPEVSVTNAAEEIFAAPLFVASAIRMSSFLGSGCSSLRLGRCVTVRRTFDILRASARLHPSGSCDTASTFINTARTSHGQTTTNVINAGIEIKLKQIYIFGKEGRGLFGRMHRRSVSLSALSRSYHNALFDYATHAAPSSY